MGTDSDLGNGFCLVLFLGRRTAPVAPLRENTMDKFSKPERASSAGAETKKALLRLAVFFFVFFTTDWLRRWLHPMGAQWFFWSLALGALATWLIVARLIPLLERKHSEANHR
jgi:hypothetical protein